MCIYIYIYVYIYIYICVCPVNIEVVVAEVVIAKLCCSYTFEQHVVSVKLAASNIQSHHAWHTKVQLYSQASLFSLDISLPL